MADSTETRILKDINRHLAHMDTGDAGEKGMTDRLSPSETAALNKNVQEIMGNFSSLVNTNLKNTIKATSNAITSAFGQMKEAEFGQIAAIDDVVDELKINNRFAEADEHNEFLKESERETDLNINRRTNELLEDLNDKEDKASATAKAEASASKSMFAGGMGGLMGGLFAGKSLKGLLGGVKRIGKKLFLPALILGAAAEFLRGWGEAGEDASTKDKMYSGISRLLSDLTFGLVSKDFFENAMIGIEKAISKAWKNFTKDWDAFVTGKMSAPDFFANLLSSLSFGTVSPDVIKDIGTNIKEGFYDLISPMVDAVVLAFQDLIDMLFGDLVAGLKELVTDPFAFFKKSKEEQKLDDIKERAAKLQEEDKTLSEGDALRQAAKDRNKDPDRGGFLENLFRKPKPGDEWKNGKWIRANETEAPLKGDKSPPVQAKPKEPSAVGQEALKRIIEKERALREFKEQRKDSGPGAAMQINNNNTVSAPADTQTENNDALSLNRSSGASGSW
jgi:hypothetical protein